MDESRACYTEWSKSKREKQISDINAYIWSLERWYWWTYLQGINGDADIENSIRDTVGEGKGRTNWESNMETYIAICKINSQWKFVVWYRELKSGALWQPRGWDGVENGVEVQEVGDICKPMSYIMLIYDRDQHNIVKQLSSNQK